MPGRISAGVFLAWLILLALPAHAQELITVTWPTKLASKPVALEKPASDYLPMFQIATATLPESQLVQMALSQPAFLGLSTASAAELQKLTALRYQMIQADPVFSKAQSALPYCYSPVTPAVGFAQVYLPPNATKDTPVLLFIHGVGGGFLWYQHLLAEILPGHVIVCPAYGVATVNIPPGYVTECLDAVAAKLGHALAKPELVGLSNGGLGACGVYTQMPSRFTRLLVLAAFPPEETVPRFGPGMDATFIVGGAEPYVTSGYFVRAMNEIRARGAALHSEIIPGADHFFLLSQKERATQLIRQWQANSIVTSPR
jgi:predicted esterase